MWKETAFGVSLAAGMWIGVAEAQEALVEVDLSNLHAEIAGNLDIEADEIPLTLQLPASLAADVCGLGAGSLSGSCTATDTMWATRYVTQAIDGDPFSTQEDDDDGVRATGAALQDPPTSLSNTAARHGF